MEKIRQVRLNGHALTLWDLGRKDEYGRPRLAYMLRYKRKTIFYGDDFHCSRYTAIDSDEVIKSLLAFLTLRPGDTDQEYFDNYTPEQIEWRDQNAEELAWAVYERFGE